MDGKLFGNKDVFAIEVNNYVLKSKKGKIRFWLDGRKMGDLKRKDELSDSIKALKLIISKGELLYDTAFDGMSIQQIFSYCLFLDKKVEDFGPEDFELFEKLKVFSLFLGEQLDNCAHVIYCKDGFYHFLWSYNNDYSGKEIDYLRNLDYAKIPMSEVIKVSLLFFEDVSR